MREQTLGEAVGLELERRENVMSAKADWEKWIKHIESHPRTADKYASDIWANNTIATQQACIEALEHKLQRILGTQEDDSIAAPEDALAKIYLICRETNYE